MRDSSSRLRKKAMLSRNSGVLSDIHWKKLPSVWIASSLARVAARLAFDVRVQGCGARLTTFVRGEQGGA